MKSLLIFCFCFLFFITIHNSAAAQAVPEIISFEELEAKYLNGMEDTLYILNFWATWCKPCVEEMPWFERAKNEFADRPVKIVMVSLDFVRQLETRVMPFIQNHNLQNEVVLLNAPRENIWIPKISEEWSGAIPATLFFHPQSGLKNFYEQSFTLNELIETINYNLKLCEN